ncbi:putative nudix domain protein [Neofusicoccum parvum]|uniref:Nudix domain protein n=1 Tax=Neofusicoccum parvum TaxID=310453 RepID=A0ACB5SCB3_9PEZI|nr:putative nudix domain protein [Neofusicoccum parvum]GME59227.1 putative nudix domain protein [Neofusicoccum parvum]
MSPPTAAENGTVSSEKAFTSPDQLAHFSVSGQAYLQRHPQYQALAVGALVFHADRLLLVQRSTTERAFPNVWEVPGGSVDPEDETILHAVARELLEETGLNVIAVTRQVGSGVEFRTGTATWLKVVFEVAVAEDDGGLRAKKEGSSAKTAEAIPIQLDPIEHQNYLWVEEADVRRGEASGTRLEFMTADQRALMLEGFRLRREQA